MKTRQGQQGGVLIISLVILLVMTLLGVSAMTGSGLQERMVGNQKQAIGASMAAEAGAITAVRWLQAHPDAWGDAGAWKAGDALPSKVPAAPNFGEGGAVYWVESIRFDGDTAMIVSRGGVLVDGKIMGQSAVTVTLRNEDYASESAGDMDMQIEGETRANDVARTPQRNLSGSTIQQIEPIAGTVRDDTDAMARAYQQPQTALELSTGSQPTTGSESLAGRRTLKSKVVGWKSLAATGSR